MQNPKRIIVATLSGVLFGFVCYGFASSGQTARDTPPANLEAFRRGVVALAR